MRPGTNEYAHFRARLRKEAEAERALGPAKRAANEAKGLVVHVVDWAQQHDQRIACDQSWGWAWGASGEKPYRLDDGRYYVHDEDDGATCLACLKHCHGLRALQEVKDFAKFTGVALEEP